MSTTPTILGQNFPDPTVPTILFAVPANCSVQFSTFVCNQSPEPDLITIALLPDGGPDTPASYIAYQTTLIGNGVLAFSGLFMNQLDQVEVISQYGTSSFTATGMLIND